MECWESLKMIDVKTKVCIQENQFRLGKTRLQKKNICFKTTSDKMSYFIYESIVESGLELWRELTFTSTCGIWLIIHALTVTSI